MAGKVLFDGVGPKTQAIDAVKGMIEYLTGEQVRELPGVVRLANGWQLTKSSKGDCYYMTSPQECSCPGFCFQRACRHVKSLRGAEEQPQKQEEQPAQKQKLTPLREVIWAAEQEDLARLARLGVDFAGVA